MLLEDELDRTTIVRLLKSVAFYQGTISEPLQQALADHIQVGVGARRAAFRETHVQRR